MGALQKKKKKRRNWDHLGGASVEATKGTDVANDAGKCRGKGCLEKR